MFIDVTRRRNPQLIHAAVELHQAGRIPSNCYVVDLDTVVQNTKVVAKAAASHRLTAYQMTKQFGRNPIVAQAVAEAGISGVVAVDFEEARLLHRYGLHIGHVGHLVQVPAHELGLAADMEPDFVTVFGFDQAERISKVAVSRGRTQHLTLRVVGEKDVFYSAQRGGVAVDEVLDVARRLCNLPGVHLRGVTSFPVVLWDEAAQAFAPTPNLTTLAEVSAMLNSAGFDAPVINAPSACCSATFAAKASAGATHVEPGSCLTGQTPLHAVSDEPERPAMVYISEISHKTREAVYGIAGGLYPRCKSTTALIYRGADSDPVIAGVELDPPDAIDYYGTLLVDDPTSVAVGDSVVYAFRAQAFVSRCFVAVVSGVESDPHVEGVFTNTGFRLDDDLLPIQTPIGRMSS